MTDAEANEKMLSIAEEYEQLGKRAEERAVEFYTGREAS
jgi:hypothetical protein